ncbi:HD domain-containing protein [Candidatus Micrarchaeota archaeon]|nr:HD domain-containing protein [Candidatus Micrarchaeota archaeon]
MIIKDELYGTIECSELERRVIDSQEFQRLHRIKQMAFTYLVYPSATHTRFEHSLGTMHLASTMAQRLCYVGEALAKIRLFALLHDVGHVAFSHESEYVLKQYLGNHEEIGKKKIMNGELADLLKENFSPKQILDIEHTTEGNIITSDLGADRMDYLMRDARNTGVAYGIVDVDRITHTLSLEKTELTIEESSLTAAESLLIARFMMFTTVYLHRAVRIAAVMLRKAISLAIENKAITPEDFLSAGDEEILLKMRASNKYADALMKRKLYKEVYSLEPNEKIKKNFKKIESELCERLKCDIIVDYPTYFYKPVNFKVKTKDGLKPITELSEIVRSLEISEQKRKRVLILAPEEFRNKNKDKVKSEFENLI